MKIDFIYINLLLLLLLLFFILFFLQKKIYIESFLNIQHIEGSTSQENRTQELPKNIFMYWHEEKISNPLVQANIEYLQKILPKEYSLRIYNEKSIQKEMNEKEYQHIQKKSKQHFADYVRLLLLEKYGGFWLDSTILVKDVSFLDEICKQYQKDPFDVFLFEYSIKNGGSGSDDKYLENWFIAAPSHSLFIQEMFSEYKEAVEKGFEEYKKKLANENVNFHGVFSDEKDVYLMQHAIIRKLIRSKKYKIAYDHAEKSMFRLQEECKWKDDCLFDKMLQIDQYPDVYGIKLVGGQRDYISKDKSDMIPTLFDKMLQNTSHITHS